MTGTALDGVRISLHPVITVDDSRSDCVQPVEEPCKVNVVHAAGVLENPVNHRGLVEVVCEARLDEVVAVYRLANADKLALVVRIAPQR